MAHFSSSLSTPTLPLDAAKARSDLERLRSHVRSVLDGAETRKSASSTEELYLKDLKEILYDAEDVLLDYDLKLLKEVIEGRPGPLTCRQVRGPEDTCGIPCWECIGVLSQKIQNKFSEDVSLRFKFKVDRGEVKAPKPSRLPTGSLVDMRKIAGRKDEMEKIIEFMLSHGSERAEYISDSYRGDEGNLTICPIVGGAGFGKTTLAQVLYNDARIKKHFEFRSWVWVQEKSTMALMKAILESIDSSVNKLSVLAVVQEKLIDKLRGKRVLLILDDAWEERRDFWGQFWANLAESVKEGSVAIITTQNYSVMQAMPPHIPQTDPFTLQPLSSASGDGAVWETSYRSLPPPLKRCFTYFALFPVDYRFKKDHLIKLWMAEGFIQSERWRNLEDIGHGYFNQLLYRSFLHHSWGADDEYTVPSGARDLATSISRNHIFRKRKRNEPDQPCVPGNVRHMSYVVGACKEEIQWPPQEKSGRLRTYLALRNNPRVASVNVPVSDSGFFQSMGYLRSLDLSHSNLVELPEAISYLKHLHFLALNYTPIKILPESMCLLYSLQTLQLRSCWNLQGLPTGIGKLIKLRHLELDAQLTSFCFPRGIGSLTDLQTLPVFNVGQNDSIHGGIEELGKLGNVKGDLCIFGLCNVSMEHPRPSSLENMKSLSKLTLCWSSRQGGSRHQQLSKSNDSSSVQADQVLRSLKPHTNLTGLIIQSYGGTRFPEWIGHKSFNRLKYIKLENCMKCERLPPLGLLPSLRYLAVDCVSVEQIDHEFCGQPNSFPAMKVLCFKNMSKLSEWCGVKNGDFPKLQELEFSNCPELTKIPQEIAPAETVTVENCEKLSELPDLTYVKTLKMENCEKLSELPDLTYVKTLKMVNCKELATIPISTSLEELELLGCDKLKEIPEITSLKILKMENCKELTTFPDLVSLDSLSLISCSAFERDSVFSKLQYMYIQDCQSCDLFQYLCQLPVLKHLVVVDMPIRQIGPAYSSQFSSLETLSFTRMDALEKWDVIEPSNLFPKLHKLELVSCPKLREFTSFAALPSLKTLQLCACNELESLPTFSSLTCLEVMYCDELTTLNSLSLLESLWVEDCQKFIFPSFGELSKLETLFISNCDGRRISQEELCQSHSALKHFEVGNTLATCKTPSSC